MKFEEPLTTQPTFFCSNEDQNRFVAANDVDGIYIDLQKRVTMDLDDLFQS